MVTRATQVTRYTGTRWPMAGRPDFAAGGGGGGGGSYTRPSGTSSFGAHYVTQESLATQTPFYSLLNQSAVGTLASPGIVTFPAGTWTWNDFAFGSNSYGWFGWDGCVGAAGSGVGVSFMKMNSQSSTQVSRIPTQGAGGVNPLWLGRFGSASNSAGRAFEFAGFTVLGTDQPTFTATDTPGHATGRPHCYNGIQAYYSNGGIFRDCQFRGIPGSYAANPGETFAIGSFHDQNTTMTNVEVDGRYYGADGTSAAGARIGGSNIGMNYGNGLTTNNCYSHDALYGAGITHYQQNGNITHNNFSSVGNELPYNYEACGASATTLVMNSCDGSGSRALARGSGTPSAALGKPIFAVMDSQFGSMHVTLNDCTIGGVIPTTSNPLPIVVHAIYPGGNGANKQLASDIHYYLNGQPRDDLIAVCADESLPDN